jgi:threonylcarbamoyladenosine tRNA methylthiotransferase MtaB
MRTEREPATQPPALMTEPRILSFGCRLNAFESEVMRGHALAAGLADAILINSCAVTGEAERQTRQAIRKARREHPQARIIVTGCAAQIDPQAYAAMPEVDHVLGNIEKLKPASFAAIARGHAPRRAVADIMTVRETAGHLVAGVPTAREPARARAFLEVQQGCDHRCTFCIIPYGRGPSRSLPLGEIAAAARGLVEAGTAEIVLTGVDLTAYGLDLPGRPTLGRMARRLLALVPELPRLRLSSIDPAEADDDIFRLLETEPRLMPHLHLSLQSGDDLILKRMKRRHARVDAIEFCRKARAARPDILLGADLIAGFPTESEAAFAASLSLVEDCGLSFLHVFPYSARRGTPAARMPQLPMGLRRERARRLREAGARAAAHTFREMLGRPLSLLVERREGELALGHSEHFAPVRLRGVAKPGEIVAARAIAAGPDGLEAERPA